MPVRDELADHRFRKLVAHLRMLMQASLKPRYQGFYGQLVLEPDAVAALGEVELVRQAARAAGRELGWKTVTHVTEGHLFVVDDRDPPEEIRLRASHDAAEAVAAVLSSHRKR
jgi:hypothetical protein